MRTLFTITVLLALISGGAFAYSKFAGQKPAVAYRTAEVERGDLIVTVTANGPVQPAETVDIGAQVVGRISELATDLRAKTDPKFEGEHIDNGSTVEKGMVLAKIDPAIYQAQYNQAKAAVERARADLIQMKAKCSQTEAEWNRAQKLSELKLSTISPTGNTVRDSETRIVGISNADFILAKANYEIAKANVEVGKAAILQQESAMQLADTNLSYTVITCPVNGTIIDRRVNIGQTVVSSMNAPSLFLIAEDMRKMEVWAQVNEGDVGRLKAGTPVTFTVDTFPDDVFRGVVSQVKLNAQVNQNVVIFTVVVSVDNSDLRLIPYLTADVTFEVDRRENVLMVPNGSLRFRPQAEQIAMTNVVEKAEGEEPSAPRGKRHEKSNEKDKDKSGTLWVQKEAGLVPLEVTVGKTDGAFTEVSGPDISEGLQVVLSEKAADQPAADVVNPFAPPRFRGGGRR